MSDLQPSAGARYLLELDRVVDAGRAEYRVTIYTPEAVFATTATLGDDGSVELVPIHAPREHVEKLEMFARLTARGAAKRREDGMVVWPARMLRWR